MVEQGQLYWGTGVVSDPTLDKLTVYTFTEVPRLSNATNFTYNNSTSIPTKNYYLDNILWQYIRFTPILDNPPIKCLSKPELLILVAKYQSCQP